MSQQNITIREILEAIEESPELQHELHKRLIEALRNDDELRQALRKEILTEELLQLPTRFAELVQVVAQLSANFAAFVEVTNRRLTKLETDVSVLKEDVSVLKEDVSVLKSDVSVLKSDVSSLKGSDLERRARDSILNIAKDELDLTRGRIMLARGRDTNPLFTEAIEDAEQRGLITEQQADHVLVADIIIRARRASDKRYVHAVFEVSQTIGPSDIQRAHDRAATVAAATNEETIAAVVGVRIHPAQQQQAEQMKVHALTPAMLRTNDPAPAG